MCTLRLPGEEPTPYQQSLSPGSCAADEQWAQQVTHSSKHLCTEVHEGLSLCKRFLNTTSGGSESAQACTCLIKHHTTHHSRYKVSVPAFHVTRASWYSHGKDDLAQDAGGDKDHRRRISKSSRLCPFKGAGSLSSERWAHLYKQTDQKGMQGGIPTARRLFASPCEDKKKRNKRLWSMEVVGAQEASLHSWPL